MLKVTLAKLEFTKNDIRETGGYRVARNVVLAWLIATFCIWFLKIVNDVEH